MRLIDADAYADKMRKKQNECRNLISEAKNEEERDRWNSVFMTFIEAKLTLDNTPTIDAEPVRHGRWITVTRHEHYPSGKEYEADYCSECHGRGSLEYDSCPHCRAKMDSEGDGCGQAY